MEPLNKTTMDKENQESAEAYYCKILVYEKFENIQDEQCPLTNKGAVHMMRQYARSTHPPQSGKGVPTVRQIRDAAIAYSDNEWKAQGDPNYQLREYAKKDFIEGANWLTAQLREGRETTNNK